MPPLTNWKKIDKKTYRYRPDESIELRIENHRGAVLDGRHSLWFADLYRRSEQLDYPDEEIVDGATTLQRARKEAVAWMRENPELPLEEADQ